MALYLCLVLLIATSFSFCLFDIIENIFVLRMLAHFPFLSAVEIAISSITTQIKLISLFLFYFAIAVTFVVSIFKLFNSNNRDLQ